MVRIGFIGCHEISWHCLKKILELSNQFHDDVVIVFNLDPVKGEKHSAYVDFDTLQKKFNLNLNYVSDISNEKNVQKLENAKLDILFIIGWHRIVPQSVLDVAKIRLGIHSSLLPKDRGPSPINWQLIRGDKVGGVTLFHLTSGVDEGSIVDMQNYRIDENDDVRTVYAKAISNSLSLLEKNWPEIHNCSPKAIPQDEQEATINERRRPSDGLIDWTKSSKECYNWIRALTIPYPGAFSFWKNQKVIVWSSRISDVKQTKPGQIMDCSEKIIVSTKNGCLELLLLQVENEPICNAKVFSQSYHIQTNDFFSDSTKN